MYKIETTFNSETYFAQIYRIEIDWDMYRTLFLRCEGNKIATFMKTTNSGQ